MTFVIKIHFDDYSAFPKAQKLMTTSTLPTSELVLLHDQIVKASSKDGCYSIKELITIFKLPQSVDNTGYQFDIAVIKCALEDIIREKGEYTSII